MLVGVFTRRLFTIMLLLALRQQGRQLVRLLGPAGHPRLQRGNLRLQQRGSLARTRGGLAAPQALRTETVGAPVVTVPVNLSDDALDIVVLGLTGGRLSA